MTTIYKNLTLLEGEDLVLRERAYLAIDADRIVEIGNGRCADGIDLDGAIVFPAFVDAHTHLADRGIKDAAIGRPTVEAVSPPNGLKYRYLRELSPDQLVETIAAAIDELLASGIVACGDFREGGAAGVNALHSAAVGKPFKAVVFGDATVLPSDPSYAMEIRSLLQLADGLGVGDVARFTDEHIDDLAKRYDSPNSRLACHVAETRDAQAACLKSHGETEARRILRAQPDQLVHFTNPLGDDLRAVAEAGVPVVCCARTNAILADGLPPIADLLTHGVPIALGTDNVMFTGPDMFREMDGLSRLARAQSGRADIVSSRNILSAATLGGARALGLAKDLGSLDPGKAACFIALSTRSMNLHGSHDIHASIVHRAGLQDVRTVVSWGREIPHGRSQ